MMQQIANFIVDHDPMMVLRRTHDTVRYIRWAWNKDHADPIDEDELRLFLCDEHRGDLTDEQKSLRPSVPGRDAKCLQHGGAPHAVMQRNDVPRHGAGCQYLPQRVLHGRR